MQVSAIVFPSQVQSHKLHTDSQGSIEVSERQRAQIVVMKQWDPGISRGLNVDSFSVISISTIPIDFNEVSDINRIMNLKQLNLSGDL
ncbi:hypothetical protein LIER_03348 [Lithospermum erythrorhizon]|uniref:Uncharacterized protein n=1 Tax=Lithospermum erythrorhizon TaxID=34254 RepID=A0AAV3NVK1_LITER